MFLLHHLLGSLGSVRSLISLGRFYFFFFFPEKVQESRLSRTSPAGLWEMRAANMCVIKKIKGSEYTPVCPRLCLAKRSKRRRNAARCSTARCRTPRRIGAREVTRWCVWCIWVTRKDTVMCVCVCVWFCCRLCDICCLFVDGGREEECGVDPECGTSHPGLLISPI